MVKMQDAAVLVDTCTMDTRMPYEVVDIRTVGAGLIWLYSAPAAPVSLSHSHLQSQNRNRNKNEAVTVCCNIVCSLLLFLLLLWLLLLFEEILLMAMAITIQSGLYCYIHCALLFYIASSP